MVHGIVYGMVYGMVRNRTQQNTMLAIPTGAYQATVHKY